MIKILSIYDIQDRLAERRQISLCYDPAPTGIYPKSAKSDHGKILSAGFRPYPQLTPKRVLAGCLGFEMCSYVSCTPR